MPPALLTSTCPLGSVHSVGQAMGRVGPTTGPAKGGDWCTYLEDLHPRKGLWLQSGGQKQPGAAQASKGKALYRDSRVSTTVPDWLGQVCTAGLPPALSVSGGGRCRTLQALNAPVHVPGKEQPASALSFTRRGPGCGTPTAWRKGQTGLACTSALPSLAGPRLASTPTPLPLGSVGSHVPQLQDRAAVSAPGTDYSRSVTHFS